MSAPKTSCRDDIRATVYAVAEDKVKGLLGGAARTYREQFYYQSSYSYCIETILIPEKADANSEPQIPRVERLLEAPLRQYT